MLSIIALSRSFLNSVMFIQAFFLTLFTLKLLSFCIFEYSSLFINIHFWKHKAKHWRRSLLSTFFVGFELPKDHRILDSLHINSLDIKVIKNFASFEKKNYIVGFFYLVAILAFNRKKGFPYFPKSILLATPWDSPWVNRHPHRNHGKNPKFI